jgi:general secretion pathway protein C
VTAVWQTRLSASGARVLDAARAVLDLASRPSVLPHIRRTLAILLVAWLAASLWRAAWSLFPEAPALPPTRVINPMTSSAPVAARSRIDIDALVAANLFGAPGTEIEPELLAADTGRGPAPGEAEAEAARALAGIEDGAPDSRLPLVLRGVIAATDAGLGKAIIEHRQRQDLYQVGDELPVSGDVVLAKVLPQRVVLDNGGRYEVLRLFEESDLRAAATAALPAARRDAGAPPGGDAPAPTGEAKDTAAGALAAGYRDRLYENPESLVDVIRISAVREGDTLRGYRLAPGEAAAEFRALGFRAGDVVTAVNGLPLSDPANTMRLYQTMRTATSATFAIERAGEVVTLDVSLAAAGGEGR